MNTLAPASKIALLTKTAPGFVEEVFEPVEGYRAVKIRKHNYYDPAEVMAFLEENPGIFEKWKKYKEEQTHTASQLIYKRYDLATWGFWDRAKRHWVRDGIVLENVWAAVLGGTTFLKTKKDGSAFMKKTYVRLEKKQK